MNSGSWKHKDFLTEYTPMIQAPSDHYLSLESENVHSYSTVQLSPALSQGVRISVRSVLTFCPVHTAQCKLS